jgi:hypothetical protein
MSKCCIAWVAIISAPIWALIFFVVSARCEMPAGMHQATQVISVDTLAFRPVPRQVPTQVLDSADSALIMKERLEQFDRRRWIKK